MRTSAGIICARAQQDGNSKSRQRYSHHPAYALPIALMINSKDHTQAFKSNLEPRRSLAVKIIEWRLLFNRLEIGRKFRTKSRARIPGQATAGQRTKSGSYLFDLLSACCDTVSRNVVAGLALLNGEYYRVQASYRL